MDMDEKPTISESENEQNNKHDNMHCEEENSNWKSGNCSSDIDYVDDIEEIRNESESGQRSDVQRRRDMSEDCHTKIDLLTFTADYETIKNLQKEAQPNINYFLALQSLINSKKFSAESLQLKRQSINIDNAEKGIVNNQKQLLNRNTEFVRDATFRQRLNVYCMGIPVEIESGDNPFQDKYSRHAFIRNVFALLFLCLTFTIIGIGICGFIPPVRAYFRENLAVSFALLYTMTGFTILLLCIVASFPFLPRLFPANLVILGLFVTFKTILLGILSALYSERAVLMAAGLTVLIVALISLFAIQTKWDITSCCFIIFIAMLPFCFAAFACLIVYMVTGMTVLYMIYCGVGVAILALYLMFDIQLIMGGGKYQISEDDCMAAVLFLYTDIVGMFVCLLGITGNN